MSTAAFLAPPPRPPHDPLHQALGARTGWRLLPGTAQGVEQDAADGALVLAPLPGARRRTGEASGSLGGLLLPGLAALDEAGTLWLLDRANRRLLWFDPCLCRFVPAPCQAALQLRDPRALVAGRGRLYIADAGPPGRVLVLDGRAMALVSVWLRPTPWQPTALALRGPELLVGDAASGALDRFSLWGGWGRLATGIGALSRLAVDGAGRLHGVVAGEDAVQLRDPAGRLLGTEADPAVLAPRFPPPPLPVAASGALDLGGLCADAGWFGPDGAPVPAPAASGPAYPTTGRALLGPIDSRMARCRWHRLSIEALRPRQAGLALSAFAAETELPPEMVAAQPDAAWSALPLGTDGREALVQRAEGRFLWLRLDLSGDGATTPRLAAIAAEYPRISLRRYLPAAFGADPVSADFADRFLGIFDRGFRDIEARIDDQAALFDPRSAPASDQARGDWLGWLGAWIGVALDRRWPEARRRRLLAGAARLFACRGTVEGMRASLRLWLGWDLRWPAAATAMRIPGCAPRCATAPAPPPPSPPMLLEHWKLRRWLFLGAGRLGDAAELWGAGILGRSQLDHTARAGVTRLDSVRDPLRDPFHRDAHRYSVFVPAHAVATPRARGALDRLLTEQSPAHAEARVVPVHPRMRIGIQASLGFDTVVGCWPVPGVALGTARLGRVSILPAAAGPPDLPPRLGRSSRLRPAPPSASREASR